MATPKSPKPRCQECGKPIVIRDPEGRKKWCSAACKMKAYWRRRLGREVA